MNWIESLALYIFKYLTFKYIKTKINDRQNILRNDGSSLVDIVILTIKDN